MAGSVSCSVSGRFCCSSAFIDTPEFPTEKDVGSLASLSLASYGLLALLACDKLINPKSNSYFALRPYFALVPFCVFFFVE